MTTFRTFKPANVLARPSRLVLNVDDAILTLLDAADGIIREQKPMAAASLSMLACLLNTSPDLVSTEALFALYKKLPEQEARVLLETARSQGTREATLHPFRTALSRLRNQLVPFGLALVSKEEQVYHVTGRWRPDQSTT